jgi:glycosyltransferase involved in cell wall biosynthesis
LKKLKRDKTMPNKILVLLNGWWEAQAGGDTHLLEIGKYLTEVQKEDIYYMIPDDAEFGDYPKHLRLIHYADPNKIGRGKDCKNFIAISRLYWKRKKAIIKYFREHKQEMKDFTQIIISGPFLYDMDPGIYFKKNINPNAKLIMYYHHTTKKPIYGGSNLRYFLAKLQEWNSIKNCKKYIDLLITSNKIEKDKLIRLTKRPVGITSHGVNWEIITKQGNTKKTPMSVCFMGRLEKSKGVGDLIEAWKIVSDKFPNATLKIIGTGVEETAMKKRVDEMRLSDKVTFCGRLSEEEKYKILLKSRVFVFPSYQEGFGIVLIEALACGCKTIAYDLDHYQSVFDNKVTRVQIGNWQELANQTIKALNDSSAEVHKQVAWCKKKFDWAIVARDNFKMWMKD